MQIKREFCLGQKPSQGIKSEHFLTKEKTSTGNHAGTKTNKNLWEYLK